MTKNYIVKELINQILYRGRRGQGRRRRLAEARQGGSIGHRRRIGQRQVRDDAVNAASARPVGQGRRRFGQFRGAGIDDDEL